MFVTDENIDSLTLEMLGESVSAHADQTARRLELLRAIDVTISALRQEREFYEKFDSLVGDYTSNVKRSKSPQQIDPEGKQEGIYSNAQSAADRLSAVLNEKKDSAASDPEVFEEDGLVDEFDRTIEVLDSLRDQIQHLRRAISEHDASLEKVIGPFNTGKDLVAALKG